MEVLIGVIFALVVMVLLSVIAVFGYVAYCGYAIKRRTEKIINKKIKK